TVPAAEQPGGRCPTVTGQRGEDDERDEGRRDERAGPHDHSQPCPGTDQIAHTSSFVRSRSGRGLARPELSPAGPIRNNLAQSLRRSTDRRSRYSLSLISPRAYRSASTASPDWRGPGRHRRKNRANSNTHRPMKTNGTSGNQGNQP